MVIAFLNNCCDDDNGTEDDDYDDDDDDDHDDDDDDDDDYDDDGGGVHEKVMNNLERWLRVFPQNQVKAFVQTSCCSCVSGRD